MTNYQTWDEFCLKERKKHSDRKREIYFFTQLGKISKKSILDFTLQDAIEASKTLDYSSYSPKKLYDKYFGSLELERYQDLLTDKKATQIPKKYTQRQHTFNYLTIRNIKYFLNYLINDTVGIEPTQIRSLKPYLKKYLIPYTQHLIEKHNTQTPIHRKRRMEIRV